jgi:hypothetical protein
MEKIVKAVLQKSFVEKLPPLKPMKTVHEHLPGKKTRLQVLNP